MTIREQITEAASCLAAFLITFAVLFPIGNWLIAGA